jgi:hypothetical protein
MPQPQNADQLTEGMRPFPIDFLKVAANAKGAGTYADYFLSPGLPAAAIAPTIAGAQCNNFSLGALPFLSAPVGKDCWLTNVQGMCSVQCGLILYDRLAHWGGLSGTITVLQTLGALTLPRYASGEGVIAFLEFYNATGATAVNATVNYVDNTDTARSVGVAMPTSPTIAQMVPIPLAAGALGVKSVTSVLLSASTGTSGNFGVTLMRRLSKWGAKANEGFNLDWLSLGMPEIIDNACLSVMGLMSSPTTGVLDLTFDFSDV